MQNNTVNDPKTKPVRYLLPILLTVAGILLLVIGLILPDQGWEALLIVFGLILLFAVAFSVRLWFIGGWIPSLFAEKERDNTDDLPPPPTSRWP